MCFLFLLLISTFLLLLHPLYTQQELSELRFRRTDRQQQARSVSPPPHLRGEMILGGELDASMTLADNNHSHSRTHSPFRGGNNSTTGQASSVRFGPSSSAQGPGLTPTRSLTRPGTANNRLPPTTPTNLRPQTAHAGARATNSKSSLNRPSSSGPSPTSTPTSTPVKSSLPSAGMGVAKPSTTPGRPPLAPGTISVSASTSSLQPTSHLPSPSPSSSSQSLSLLQQHPRGPGNTTQPRPNTATGVVRPHPASPSPGAGRTSPGPPANKGSEENAADPGLAHPSSNRSPLHSRAPSPINSHPGASPGHGSNTQASPSVSRTLARPSTASSYLGRSNTDRDHAPTENYR